MAHLWLLFCLTPWLKVESQGFGINLIKMSDDDPAQIMCTVALLGKYFYSGPDLSGSVLHMSITSASSYLQASLLHALHTDRIYPWTIVVENAETDSEMEVYTKHILHEKPQCYLFVIEDMENVDMDKILENWKINLNWNPLAQFVVYYAAIEETEEEMTDIIREILLNFMNKKIYNVNVIGRSEENSFYFGKTVLPYHPDNNCGNRIVSVETLDICDYLESEREQDDDYKAEEGDKEVEMEDKEEYDGSENRKENYAKGSFKSNEDSERQAVIDNKNNEDNLYFQNVSSSATSRKMFLPIMKIKNFTEIAKNSRDLVSEYNNFAAYTDNSTQSVYPKLYIEEISRQLFFDKFPKDLSGCPLVAAFRPWEPYIFYEHLDNSLYVNLTESGENNQTSYKDTYGEEAEVGKNYGEGDDFMVYNKQMDIEGKIPDSLSVNRLNGIEYKMIQTIAERLHISIEMQVENNNLYHLFQQLLDGDIEMIVGGIDEDPNISQFVSSTKPYYQDDLTWCVARAEHIHNLFNFLATFQIDAWLLTFTFILTASLSIFMTQKFLKLRLGGRRNYFRINIYVMGIILSQAISLRPIPTSLKLSFGTIFFMGLMFSNIYQSFLVSTLTTPKALYQISHLHEIYQNRMQIVGSAENVRHLNKEGEIYRYVREQFQMCYNIEECLQHAAKDRKLAVVVSRQHFLYNPRIPHDRLYCFDRNENIYVFLVTILMPKKFHLLHKINPVIQHIIESGHMQKWARDLDMRRKINKQMQHARDGQLKHLTLSEVAGSFAFNGLLLTFALWIFCMECAVYWLVVKHKTRLKLAKYMHRKFL